MSRERETGRAEGRRGREPIEPIYRRLPRGPHALDRKQIAVHQRARIQGAMVEAVARGGYDGVTVRQLIGFAAVSRRSFYEHFANRHDCFLRTARTIGAGGTAAARAALEGGGDGALQAAVEALVAHSLARPADTRLALLETLAAGDDGALVLAETLSSWEMLLRPLLTEAPGAPALPAPVLLALTGALHGVIVAAVDGRAGAPASEIGRIAASLVPVGEGTGEALSTRLHDRERRAALAAAAARPGAAAPDLRERLLQSALRAVAGQPVRWVGAAQIAGGAGLTIDEFEAHFADDETCLREAFSASARRLVTIARRARELAAEPPQATRLALAGTLGELAANPVAARALALVAHRAGPAAARLRETLDGELGDALLDGLAAEAPSSQAAAGAFWHTVRTALLAGRAPLLPALSDHLAYLLLAPTIGTRAAIEALGGAGALSGAGRGARRSA